MTDNAEYTCSTTAWEAPCFPFFFLPNCQTEIKITSEKKNCTCQTFSFQVLISLSWITQRNNNDEITGSNILKSKNNNN